MVCRVCVHQDEAAHSVGAISPPQLHAVWHSDAALRTPPREVEAALRAYVAATGVVPVNLEMIRQIPDNQPGQVRDVMAADAPPCPTKESSTKSASRAAIFGR